MARITFRLDRAGARTRDAERYIGGYVFPRSVTAKVERQHPELAAGQLDVIEEGLRQRLICCAHRERAQLGMPARAIDWAWHEFILHTPAYHDFCRTAFGEYLHHVPEEGMLVRMEDGLEETVRAWDRSEAGRSGQESLLWDLDAELGVRDSIGVSAAERAHARAAGDGSGRRTRKRRRGVYSDAGGAWLSGLGGGCGAGGGSHGGGCGGGCGGGG